MDKGYNKKGIWGTAVGPLGHPEVATVGLDDLQDRCKKAYDKGARFAKWRNVLQLDPAKGLPSDLAIADTVHTLARYASICQSEGLVPIVEPEIVPNGTSALLQSCYTIFFLKLFLLKIIALFSGLEPIVFFILARQSRHLLLRTNDREGPGGPI